MTDLAEGRGQAAWDHVADRYSRLMIATIRRVVHDYDDVMDAYASVCQALCADDFARLRRYADSPERARFSTWLVAVVRNLTIDWRRQRDGRHRREAPSELSELTREIYSAIFLEGRSHVEAYELIAARRGVSLTFRTFLDALRDAYRNSPRASGGASEARKPPSELPSDLAAPVTSGGDTDAARLLGEALASLTTAQRVALQLFVVEGMAAADVASVVGWANAKAVYNNVYRTLEALRARFDRLGLRLEDLV